MNLHDAVKAGDVETVRVLLEQGVNPHLLDSYGKPALLHAVYGGSEEIVRLLLQAGVDVNARYFGCGVTALHWAADGDCEYPQMVRLLLEYGADVNARDERGWTPLQWALPEKDMEEPYGNPEAVRLLRERGGQE